MGPFVVNQLSTSGAVFLKTLEGAQMPNFINGNRLKCYEGPLMTEKMLEHLHRAKTYKEGQRLLKEEAQKEAQRHRKRMRERKEAQILMVSHISQDEEFEPIPPFLLDM